MSFFDKKSDVISVELTQYGKYLLSLGKFKPVYYEFFDNDVIYDGEYAGINEGRNDIQERIKNETPTSKPQYVFTGVETKLKEQIKLKRKLENLANKNTQDESLQQTPEKIYFGTSPLGTSNLDDTYPAFNILSHNNKISSSIPYKLENTHVIPVPQINMDTLRIKTEIVYDSEEPVPDKFIAQSLPFQIEDGPKEQTFKLFEDGTYIAVREDSIILEFNEINSKDVGENFEIEIFEITASQNNKEIYVPLYFIGEKYTKNNDNVVIDVGNKQYTIPANDPTLVDYYMNINVDDNIEKSKLDKANMKPATPKLLGGSKK